jgi:lipoate-protein ligase A
MINYRYIKKVNRSERPQAVVEKDRELRKQRRDFSCADAIAAFRTGLAEVGAIEFRPPRLTEVKFINKS